MLFAGQHTWWWFLVDLARKVACPMVFLLGTAYGFDWQTVLLVVFVVLAMMQDAVQVRLDTVGCIIFFSKESGDSLLKDTHSCRRNQ